MKRSNKDEYIISLDLGSSNLKTALFDNSLNRIIEKSSPLKYLKLENQYVQFDGNEAWKVIKKLLLDIIKAGNIRLDHKVSIVVCSQANTFAVIGKDGNLKMPFISWLDDRAVDESRILNKRFKKNLALFSGHSIIIPQSVISKILWIKKNKPGMISNGDVIIPFSSYIMYKLTGGIYYDKNIATLDCIYSVREDKVWGEVFDFLRIKERQIPELVEVGFPLVIKKVTSRISEIKRIQFLFAGNDQTAAAIGNCLTKDVILISLGTALSFYRYRDNIGPYGKDSFWGKFPLGGYYEIFASSYGTKILDKVIEKHFPNENIEDLTKYAKRFNKNTDTCNQLLFYPNLLNYEYLWTSDGSPSAIALSIFEGMSFYIKFVLRNKLNIDSPHKFKILVTGGGSANYFWLQLISNILNSELTRSRGDALLGAAEVALGSDLKFKKNLGNKFYPIKKKAEFYDNLYNLWVSNFDRLKN